MRYTTLGRTGMSVSRLALGCMSYGDPAWRPWVLDEAAAKPFFQKAIEAGINFFDTADSYGPDVSEILIAEALHPYPKDLVVGTKGGLTRPSRHRWDEDGRPEHLRRAVEGSRNPHRRRAILAHPVTVYAR